MNKAISPLIAGVILIAFTIVAGILVTSALTSITKQQTEATTIKQQCPLASLEILSTSCESTNITQEQENWWDSSYSYRQQITVTNNAGSILEQDYTISTEFDLNTCVNQEKCLASGNDTRIIWYNSSSEENIELDRILEPSSALSFDGTDDHVLVGDMPTYQNFTVEAWIYPTDLSLSGDNGQTVISKWSSDGQEFTLGSANQDEYDYVFSVNTGSIYSASKVDIITQEDKWYHIAGEKDGTTIRLYVDGVMVAETTGVTGSISDGPGNVRIGTNDYWVTGGPDHWQGTIDEVNYYSYAKYQGGNFTPSRAPLTNYTNVVASWHLDNAYSNTTAKDSSGNGWDGTLQYNSYFTDGKIVPNAEALNTIYFKTQENITTSDANYSLYYGNTVAGDAPANGSNVYLFYEHFDDGVLNSDWVLGNSPYTGTSYSPNGYRQEPSSSQRVGRTDGSTTDYYGYPFQYNQNISFSNQTIIELRMLVNYETTSSASHQAMQGFYLYNDQSGFEVFNGWTTGATGWHKKWIRIKQDGAWSNCYVEENIDTRNVWKNYKVEWVGDTVSLYEDGTLRCSSTAFVPMNYILGEESTGHDQTWSYIDIDNIKARKYISPEPSLSLGTENKITTGITQSYQLTTTIYNPSQIELTNITAIAVIGNNTYTQTTPYSISQGQYLTINTNASAGLIEKIRISALNCPVYIEALDVGRCE